MHQENAIPGGRNNRKRRLGRSLPCWGSSVPHGIHSFWRLCWTSCADSSHWRMQGASRWVPGGWPQAVCLSCPTALLHITVPGIHRLRTIHATHLCPAGRITVYVTWPVAGFLASAYPSSCTVLAVRVQTPGYHHFLAPAHLQHELFHPSAGRTAQPIGSSVEYGIYQCSPATSPSGSWSHSCCWFLCTPATTKFHSIIL